MQMCLAAKKIKPGAVFAVSAVASIAAVGALGRWVPRVSGVGDVLAALAWVSWVFCLSVAVAPVVSAQGQTQGQTQGQAPGQGRSADREPVLNVAVDGLDDEWPREVVANTDGYYLYLKVFAENLRNLQMHEQVIRINLDVDDNDETGDKRARNRGTDLRIDFSPRLEDFGKGRDLVSVRQYPDVGPTRRVPPEEVDLLAMPTHASRYFELRISRFPAEEVYYPSDGLLSQGPLSGTIEVLSFAALPLDPPRKTSFEINMGPRAEGPLRVDKPFPAKPEDAMRVVVWQSEWGKLLSEPARSRRVLRCLDPDVVLLQRTAYPGDVDAVAAWFNDAFGVGEGDREDGAEAASADVRVWTSLRSPVDDRGGDGGGGVTGTLTLSRLPLKLALPSPLWATPDRKAAGEAPIDLIASVVRFRDRWVGLFNVALTAGGGLESDEDRLRNAEVQPINWLGQALSHKLDLAGLIVAGQFNLSGQSEVIERKLLSRLDGRRSLTDVEPWVHGTRSQYTYGVPGRRLVRGVRANAAYSASGLELVNGFVADPALLSDAVLEAGRLQRDDLSFATDYPFVLDLRLKDAADARRP